MKGELVQQLHWGAKKFSCGQQQLRSKLHNNNNRCVQAAIDEEQGTKGDANWCGA